VDGPDIHSAMIATTHVWYMLCAVMLPCWWITPCNISLLWTNEATFQRSSIINTIGQPFWSFQLFEKGPSWQLLEHMAT